MTQPSKHETIINILIPDLYMNMKFTRDLVLTLSYAAQANTTHVQERGISQIAQTVKTGFPARSESGVRVDSNSGAARQHYSVLQWRLGAGDSGTINPWSNFTA